MNLRPLLLSLTAISTLLLAAAVQAHDPSLHAPAPAAKAKPATCAQLADAQRYSNDLADPDIKALKARCDAADKHGKSGTGKKPANGTK